VEVARGLDATIYHRKYLKVLYSPKSLLHQALFSLFETLNKTYSTPCHEFIVYPLSVREEANDEDASLVFINVCKLDYQIGVPADHDLQQLYINELSRVIEIIHGSGFVHLDLYPSNIMWRYDDQRQDGGAGGGGMSILVIDWDSIHEIGKKYDSKTQDILKTKRGNRRMNVIKASTEWDSAHFHIIKNHLSSFVRQL
jgi:serine/threonine protein kinase